MERFQKKHHKEKVQFQNGIPGFFFSSSTGSIPLSIQNLKLFKVNRFNSRIEADIVFIQSPLRPIPYEEKPNVKETEECRGSILGNRVSFLDKSAVL